MTPQQGKAPLNVTLDGSSSRAQRNAGPISAYQWDFDSDGTVDQTTTTATTTHVFTDPGNYDVTLTVVGSGANPAQTSITKSLTVTGAVVTITAKPDRFTNETSAHFEFTNSEGTQFECKLDGAADWTPCESPLDLPTASEEDPDPAFAEGEHTLQIRGLDDEGAPGLPTSYTWTVDQTNPTVAITSAPQPRVNGATNEADITFTGNDGVSAGDDLAFECRYDSVADEGWQSCTSPKHVTWPNEEGSHTIEVRSIDQAGNKSESRRARGPSTSRTRRRR